MECPPGRRPLNAGQYSKQTWDRLTLFTLTRRDGQGWTRYPWRTLRTQGDARHGHQGQLSSAARAHRVPPGSTTRLPSERAQTASWESVARRKVPKALGRADFGPVQGRT